MLFAWVATMTPGPNNLMLLSSGALFGFKRTLPLIFGVVLGYLSVLLMAVLGSAQVLLANPEVMYIVKVLGALWLCWLSTQFFMVAWQANQRDSQSDVVVSDSQPIRFYQAFLFQWINPKSLVNSIACASAFMAVASSMWYRATIIGLVFLFFSGISSCLWAAVGGSLKRLLSNPRQATILNVCFGVLILATVCVILWS